MQTNKQLICQLLGIMSEEYELQLFESAFQFLQTKLPDDEEAQTLLTNGRSFWIWWTSQWESRNRVILHTYGFADVLMNPSEVVRKRARISYDAIHKVDQLNIMINRTILRRMLQQTIRLEKVTQSQTH
jgi:hypothetical protein